MLKDLKHCQRDTVRVPSVGLEDRVVDVGRTENCLQLGGTIQMPAERLIEWIMAES